MIDRSGIDEPTIMVGLGDGPVEAQQLDWPGACGGECIFLGRTRQETHPELGELLWLDYEVYAPMAEKLLADLARDAAERFGCDAVRMVHGRGTIRPGEASVVIQVAAAHRDEAFAACRHLIDRIKRELPVWKREIWAGGQTFVDGCCARRETDRPAGVGT